MSDAGEEEEDGEEYDEDDEDGMGLFKDNSLLEAELVALEKARAGEKYEETDDDCCTTKDTKRSLLKVQYFSIFW